MKKKRVETHKNDIKTQDTANMNKRAEESQSENAEKYQNILKNIHDGCFELDLAGNFTFFNDSACRILGYSRKELMGMNYRHYTDKENAKKVSKAYLKVYNTGKPSKGFSWQVTRKDGAKRYIETSVSLQKDSSGKPTGFIGIVNDITERKQAEDVLRQEQQFSKLVLDSLPRIFYLYTYPENRLVLWNKQVETLLGFNAEEIKDRLVTEWFPPENREATLKAIEEVMEKGQNSIEASLMTKDGHQIPFFLTGVRFDVHGQLYFMGIGTDISERKRAEEQYRTLVENASDIVFRTDDSGHFTFVNPAMLSITGYGEEEILGKHYKMLFRPDKYKETMKLLVGQYENRVQNTYHEFPILTKDGREKWIGQNAQLIVESDHVIGFQAVARDITERKLMEEALRQSEEKYRSILETIQEGYFEVDLNGNFTFCNDSMARLTGYSKDELLGMNY